MPVSVRDLVGTRSHLLYLTVLPPLYFGIAHIHHFYEFRLTHPSVPLVSAVVRSALQLAYTTLFGAYASYLFLKTGSLPAVIILHVFCNWVGLPRLWGRVGGTVMAATADIAATSSGPGRSEGDRGQEESEEEDEERNDVHTDSTPGGLDCAHKHAPHLHPVARLSDLWTASYYFLLVAGAYAFGHGLMAFRSSQNALITR